MIKAAQDFGITVLRKEVRDCGVMFSDWSKNETFLYTNENALFWNFHSTEVFNYRKTQLNYSKQKLRKMSLSFCKLDNMHLGFIECIPMLYFNMTIDGTLCGKKSPASLFC